MSECIINLLNSDQRQKLLAQQHSIDLGAGEVLFEQGDDADHMYLVNKGRVSLYRLMPNGDEKLFRVFLPGDLIAEMAMFMEPRRYPMSAKVEQESELSAFHYQDVLALFSESSEISIKVMGFMSNRICRLMDSLNILTQVHASQRLVMKLAELYRAQANTSGKITIPVTKKLLATQLGMTPETLSRTLKKLKQDGHISDSGDQISLLNITNLCHSVELAPDIFKAS